MSKLIPTILTNPNYATNTLDTEKAGWYQIQPSSSNVALRVNYSNIGLSGEVRLNNTVSPPVFQGNNGSAWVTFNATQGVQGPPVGAATCSREFKGSSESGGGCSEAPKN